VLNGMSNVKNRMSNAKQGNGESVVHNKPEYVDVQCYDVLLILYVLIIFTKLS